MQLRLQSFVWGILLISLIHISTALLSVKLETANEVLYTAPVTQDVFNLGNGTLGNHLTGKVVFLQKQHVTLLGCNVSKALAFPENTYAGNIVIVADEAIAALEEACGEKDSSTFFPLTSLAFICAFAPLAVVSDRSENLYRGLYVMNNEASAEILEETPHLQRCTSLRVRDHVPNLGKMFNGSNHTLRGEIVVDELDIVMFFNSPILVFFYKGVLSSGYLMLSVLSVYFFVRRGFSGKLNEAYVLVLVSTAIAMLLLGVAQCIGTFFVYGYVSSYHRNIQLVLTTQFFGIGAANDYFAAMLYKSIVDKNVPQNISRRHTSLVRTYPKLATLGVILLVLDLGYAYLILVSDRSQTRFFRALMPSIILLLQVSVTTFLVLAVRKVIKQLSAVNSSYKKSMQTSQQRLERRMRFWVKVNCVSSTATVALASLVAMGSTASSPGPYFWSLTLLIVSKQTQVLSQVMIARPPPRSDKVHATHSLSKQTKRSTIKPIVGARNTTSGKQEDNA